MSIKGFVAGPATVPPVKSHGDLVTINGTGFGTLPASLKSLWIMGDEVFVNGVSDSWLAGIADGAFIKGKDQTNGSFLPADVDANSYWWSTKYTYKKAAEARHARVASAFYANSRLADGNIGSCELVKALFDDVNGSGGSDTAGNQFYATFRQKFHTGTSRYTKHFNYSSITGTHSFGDKYTGSPAVHANTTFIEDATGSFYFHSASTTVQLEGTVLTNITTGGTITITTVVQPLSSTKVVRAWNINGANAAFGLSNEFLPGTSPANLFKMYRSDASEIRYTSAQGTAAPRLIAPETGDWPSISPNSDMDTAWHRIEYGIDYAAYRGLNSLDLDVNWATGTVIFDAVDYTDIDASVAAGNVTLSNWGMDGQRNGNESAWGELYTANSLMRVELGNAPTYAACTDLEIQRVITADWTDTAIDFVVNQGGFADLTNKYIYPIGSDGLPNNSNGVLLK